LDDSIEKKMSQPIKLFIATPCYGGNLHYQYVVSLFSFAKTLDKLNIKYTISFLGNESLITRARNIMVGKFLSDPACTHLFFIDADIQFPIKNALKLLQADKDVCYGVYPAKKVNFEKFNDHIGTVENIEELKSICLNYMVSYEQDDGGRLIIDWNQKLMKVKYGTTGFMMIKRNAIERLTKAFPDLQYRNKKTCELHRINPENLYLLFDCRKDDETHDYLSEDYAFCDLWRKIGGEVWADLESRLTHWGNYAFQGDYQLHFEQMNKKRKRYSIC
jgi:hypothetical protein